MTEVDFVKLGFTLRGDGTLRAPAGSRLTLVIDGAFVKLTLALANGNSLETWVSRSSLKVQRAAELKQAVAGEFAKHGIVDGTDEHS